MKSVLIEAKSRLIIPFLNLKSSLTRLNELKQKKLNKQTANWMNRAE